MGSFSAASLAQLATCHHSLKAIADEAIKTLEFKVLKGHRGQVEQDQAFAEGKSKLKWPHGNHNALPSRAMDVAPGFFDRGVYQINWKDLGAFARLMGHLERIAIWLEIPVRLGMDWDGDWRTAGHDPGENFLDAPHIELAEKWPWQ